MSDLIKLIELLELSPVCVVIFLIAAALAWNTRRLTRRLTEMTDRFIESESRRARLWDDYRREAEG